MMMVLGQMAVRDEGGSLLASGNWVAEAVSVVALDRHMQRHAKPLSQRSLARINTAKVSAISIRDAPTLSVSSPVPPAVPAVTVELGQG